MSKITEARAKATEIQNERGKNKNTAERVGTALHAIIDTVDAATYVQAERPTDAAEKSRWLSTKSGIAFQIYQGVPVQF